MDKHQPHLGDSYGQLLQRLRKDLQLDLSTDALLPPFLPAVAGAFKIAFGTVTLTWPGATTFAGNQTITHGLGTTPAAVLLGSQFMSAAPFAFTPFVNSALGAATFLLSGQTDANPAAATTGVAWWAAIG